ncbi:acetoin utilization protein AcuB [Alkalihalobacillus alcalophilus ATCC 27647 = CGMCC 1.3604]|uniref:Acetoin utilization protein AcuB n=1 Tax=Alkalihalobacillus alcalophilus ATCC 27647 = CGMCC 1.3604 TaxID=1218173 RepID=A0A094WFQ8_ALKAL|nr:acetoin utilization AcuB family protein [Alkalihalobacillus alcalophilus]KGA96614.1 acetoin utilization protein AcuB [Alkalihalobacillus alcalophilus ATCC 27647 = CGMCC 1.3604]MED1561695.1 acetoin utilization AcuB family protein [Alkalihalobacillus alcalophilus]THG92260.1 acetoin utilization protein AcuB [Alkalihalobacillus alcalophilus ATCC 27647 = CGMCC 1.3604]
MIVEEIMQKEVITLQINATIQEAIQTLEENRIRHLPIMNENNHLVGIISDRDIRDARPSIFSNKQDDDVLSQPITNLMTTNVITAHPLDFIQDASSIFYSHRVGCLPILDNQKLVGIITEKEVLYCLTELIGAHQPSSHIEIKVPNKMGVLADVASIFKNYKINIISVIVRPCDNQGDKILIFRIQTIDPRRVIQEIHAAGYEVLWPSIPGGTR